jgi:hypothetical protein
MGIFSLFTIFNKKSRKKRVPRERTKVTWIRGHNLRYLRTWSRGDNLRSLKT